MVREKGGEMGMGGIAVILVAIMMGIGAGFLLGSIASPPGGVQPDSGTAARTIASPGQR